MAPKAGTVVVPNPVTQGQKIILNRENTYSGIKFYLGVDWAPFLDGTYDIFFTAKSRYTDPNAEFVFDVACTVVVQAEGTVTADLDAMDTDHNTGEYLYQIQILSQDGPDYTTVKTALTGKLHIVHTVKDI